MRAMVAIPFRHGTLDTPLRRATVDELVDHCWQSMGGFTVSRSMTIRDDPLPKSGAGKILRRDLRSACWPASGASAPA